MQNFYNVFLFSCMKTILSIKNIPESNQSEDTMAKKQKSSEPTPLRSSRCLAGKNRKSSPQQENQRNLLG